MSMEICVLSDSRLDSIPEWQRSIDAEGFSLHLPHEQPLAETGGGNLLALLNAKPTAIEYSIIDLSELKETYKSIIFGRDWKYVIGFTWWTNFGEGVAAWMAATAYARATSGVVFDEQEGKLLSPEESLQITQDIKRSLPEMEAALRHYVEQLSTKSPETDAALRAFMRRRSTKRNPA